MTNLMNVLALSATGLLAAPAHAGAWSHGIIDVTESFADYVLVRWSGPDTQSCGAVRIDASSLGNTDAFRRAFAIALTAETTQRLIRFYLDGCFGSRQRATVVQLCRESDCSYR